MGLTALRDSISVYIGRGGGSGGAKVLGKLPVPGRPTYLDCSRAGVVGWCDGAG